MKALNIMKTMTKVVENKVGGCIFIGEENGSIILSQIIDRYNPVHDVVEVETRSAVLTEDVGRIMIIGLSPGDVLQGNILTRQQLEPITNDYKQYQIIDALGVYYSMNYYSEDSTEDKLLDRSR